MSQSKSHASPRKPNLHHSETEAEQLHRELGLASIDPHTPNTNTPSDSHSPSSSHANTHTSPQPRPYTDVFLGDDMGYEENLAGLPRRMSPTPAHSFRRVALDHEHDRQVHSHAHGHGNEHGHGTRHKAQKNTEDESRELNQTRNNSCSSSLTLASPVETDSVIASKDGKVNEGKRRESEDESRNVQEVDGYLLTREDDKTWVDFAPGSPHDPTQWSNPRKWTMTCIVCLFTLLTSLNLSSYAQGEGTMESDTGGNALEGDAGMSLFAWGFAIFPLVLAPVSEQFGRRPVFLISCLLWTLFYLPIGFAHSMGLVLPFRFLQGGAGSVGATLSAGVVADIWHADERGTKMAVYAVGGVIGSGLAPIFMSWVEMSHHLGWRWIQWIQIIVTGAYLPSLYFILKETRSSILLERAARRFRGVDGGKGEKKGEKKEKTEEKVGGKETIYMARSEVGKPKLWQMMKTSCVRPIHMLFTEPIVLFMSIWISVGWGVLYGELEAIGYVFKTVYGFNDGQVGLTYIAMVVGTLSSFGTNFIQNRLYLRNVDRKGAEARLYLAMVGGIGFAAGAFIFAWTSFPHVHWIAPCIGIAVMIWGIFSIYLAIFLYLSDMYAIYASSAMAASSFLRNMIAGAFPMFIIQTYERLGINWASSLFGFMAALLAIVPFIAYKFGPQIRERSKFSKLLLAEERRLAKIKEEAALNRHGRQAV